MFTDFIKRIENLIEIRKREVVLPIAGKTVLIKPLKVGDDLALRTLLASPVNYDKEITKILWRNSEVINPQTNEIEKLTYNDFISILSNIDKIVLMWGMYASTYSTLGVRTVKCNKCGVEFKVNINVDDLIHEDTLMLWEEDVPFQQYIYPIRVEYGKITYCFDTHIPSIRDNNRVLSNISVDVLQKNLETTRMILSRSEQMVLLTKKLSVVDTASGNELASTDNISDLLLTFRDYIPYDVSEVFFEEYRNKFDKYNPKFYIETGCPGCSENVRLDFDIELEFFRRVIFGRESGEQEL